jgi:hypothetical protein
MGPSNDYSCTAWFQSSLYSFSEKNINLYFVNEHPRNNHASSVSNKLKFMRLLNFILEGHIRNILTI